MTDRKVLSSLVVWILAPWFLFGNLVPDPLAQDAPETGKQKPVGIPQTKQEAFQDISLKPGDEAPKFALPDLDGDYELLSKWSGVKLSRPATQPIRHVVLVSFFATWCAPCMKELPHLQNLYEKYQGEHVKFFLIDITEATRSVPGVENSPEAGPFLRKRGITMPILIDVYGKALEQYVPSKLLPRLFVVDKSRKIRLIKRGFREEEDFEGELSAVIEKLLAEKVGE